MSRKTTYKWIERYEAGGWRALQDQSRAPRHHPNAVSAGVEQALLDLKQRWPLWGAPKLRAQVRAKVRGRWLPGREHGERDPAAARVEPDRAASAPSHPERATVRGLPASQRGVVRGFQGLVPHGRWQQVHDVDHQRRSQPVSSALPGPGWIDRVQHGGAALYRDVPGVRDAAGHPHRQRDALCQHGPWRLERVIGLVGATGLGGPAHRAGAAAAKRTARTDASHTQGRHGPTTAGRPASAAKSL